MSSALVFKLHRRFPDGQDRLEEQEGRGRKKHNEWRDDGDVNVLCAGLRQTTDDRGTGAGFYMVYGTIHRILTELLQMSEIIPLIRPYMLQMVSQHSEYSE